MTSQREYACLICGTCLIGDTVQKPEELVCGSCVKGILGALVASMEERPVKAMEWLAVSGQPRRFYWGCEADAFRTTVGRMAALFVASRGRHAGRCLAAVETPGGRYSDWDICLEPATNSLEMGADPDGRNNHVPLCDNHSGYRRWQRIRDDGTKWGRCHDCGHTRLIARSTSSCVQCKSAELDDAKLRLSRLEQEVSEARKRLARAEEMGGQPALVYYIHDHQGICIRVGHTRDWENRKRHYRRVSWTVEIDWQRLAFSDFFATVAEAKKFEAAEIERLKPRYNVHHVGKRTVAA